MYVFTKTEILQINLNFYLKSLTCADTIRVTKMLLKSRDSFDFCSLSFAESSKEFQVNEDWLQDLSLPFVFLAALFSIRRRFDISPETIMGNKDSASGCSVRVSEQKLQKGWFLSNSNSEVQPSRYEINKKRRNKIEDPNQ